MEQIPEKGQEPRSSSSEHNTSSKLERRAPYAVTLYHVAIFSGVGVVILSLHKGWILADDGLKRAVHSLCFGSLGGTLMASRYVVYAVRHRNYDGARILWQLLTPLHSAILAAISILAVR